MINGVTKVVMTKADVLDAFETLNVCNAYNIDGTEKMEVPFQMTRVNIDPVYKSFPGWNTDSSIIRTQQIYSNQHDRLYRFTYKRNIGAPVKYVSNGPGETR